MLINMEKSIDNKYQVPFPSVCEQYWHDKKIENIDKLLRILIGTIDKNIEKYGEYIESIDNKYQVPSLSVCVRKPEQYWQENWKYS